MVNQYKVMMKQRNWIDFVMKMWTSFKWLMSKGLAMITAS